MRRTGGGFQPGHVPWVKGRKGLHLSPATEFKPGRPNGRERPLGAETIRVDKNGSRRVYVKISETKWQERAVAVWISAHGPIPRGMVIHHRDRDTMNDDLTNLQMMTRREHANEHRAEQLATRRRMREERAAPE